MLNTTEIQKICTAIRCFLWDKNAVDCVDFQLFEELKQQTIASLAWPVIENLEEPQDLLHLWKAHIIRNVAFYHQYIHVQNSLPIDTPYVILKGTSASQYYPYPEFREMGDIDIMPKREDFETVCRQLLENGFIELDAEKSNVRHRKFYKNGITVEVHLFFAYTNNASESEFLDNLIYSTINTSHVLPDVINGLVLLEHINQHVQEGLGFRQIIDWMMFVNRCLPDEKWEDFMPLAQKTGLVQLAIITTKMCEIYLGLPHRDWCEKADKHICKHFLEYIFECGNFGHKKDSESEYNINTILSLRNPKSAFKLLNSRGISNWNAAQKYKFLRPFAWVYQIVHYSKKSFVRDNSIRIFRDEYKIAKDRNALFDSLGVIQKSRGMIIYKNGKYLEE